MRISAREPGIAISAAVHFGLLAFLLVNFSRDPKFEDAQEAVPVETITDAQFSQIMKGEKTGKEQNSKLKVDRVAEKEESKPTPPTPQAKQDVPTPPSSLKRLPDPSEAEDEPPTPAPPVPPPRPAPPKQAVKPPPEPEEKEEADAEVAKPKPPPKPPEKPKPAPPKLDQVAKLLAQTHDKPAPKPKSGQEAPDGRPSPNLSAIAKLLSHDRPSSTGSSGRDLNKVASIGAPHASAARMSPSLSDALNGLLQDQYKQCWVYLGLSNGPKYVPRIRVSYRADGSLAGEPSLTNPSSDPAARSLADSALRAVRRCNPLKIPAQFQPYYEQWKDWVVGFDPDNLN